MELTGLTAWLKFDKSPTDDFVKSNQWEVYGNPTIGAEKAISGNALQLDGQSYLKLSNVNFGGANFTIEGWCYVNSDSPDNARIISIVNPINNIHLLSLRKTSDGKLQVWCNETTDCSSDSGFYTGKVITASDTSGVNQMAHFRIKCGTYWGDNCIRLYINDFSSGAFVIPKNPRNNFAREYVWQNYDIYVGSNYDGSQKLTGSIDEILIYSNNTGLTGVPTSEYYQTALPLILDADTKRNIKNPPLTWRYENLGTADLLTQAGTTVTNLEETQSKTGVAFYQPTRAKCFDIPDTKEIWLKCDIYTTANFSGSDRIRIYNADSNDKVCGWSTGGTATSNYLLWHNDTSITGSAALGKNKDHAFLLHMKSDATNGVVEYFFSNGDTDKFVGNVNAGDDFANVYIQMDGSNILVSNLIISNAPLDIDDDVAELRHKVVEFTAATRRIISKTLTLPIETSRNVIKPTEINFLLRRDVVQSLQVTSDTKREISRSLELLFGTIREVTSANLTPVEKYFDVVRNITNAVTVANDTTRDAVKSLAFANDTERKIIFAVSCSFDTRRKITNTITVFADTKRLKSNLVAVNFDTLRKLSDSSIWRYEDYGALGGGVKYVPKTQSKYLIGNRGNTGTAFDVPATNEVWIKFDAYAEEQFSFGNEVYGHENHSIYLEIRLDKIILWNDDYDYNPTQEIEYTWTTDRLHTCLLHMWSGENDGLIELWIDSEKVVTFNGNVADGDDFQKLQLDVYYGSLAPYAYIFSNIIISNEEIGFNENAKYPMTTYYDTERKTSADAEIVYDGKWRYEDYGGAGILADESITVNLDKSKYGVGAYRTQTEILFDTPATDEIYFKFDFYVEDIQQNKTSWKIHLRDTSGDKVGVAVGTTGNGVQSYYEIFCYSIGAYDTYGKNTLNTGLNTCLVHMKAGTQEGIIEVWVNGELKKQWLGNVNNGENFGNMSLYSTEPSGEKTGSDEYATYHAYGYKEVLFSNVIISNKEIGLSENCKVSVEDVFDTKRLLISLWNGDTWRYENYGTTELLSIAGIQVNCEKAKSVYYQGFHQPSRLRCFDIPNGKEIWVKFDVYTTLSKRWRAYNDPTGGSGYLDGICSQTGGEISFFAQSNSSIKNIGNMVKNQRQTVLLHMVSDATNGTIEAWLDGNLLNTYTGNVNNGEDFNNFYLQSDGKETFFSNVIISNKRIGLDENAKMWFKEFYDVQISVPKVITSHFDIVRNVEISQNIRVDLLREVKNLIAIFNDTCRDLVPSVRVDFDTARSIPHKIKVMPIPVTDFSALQTPLNTNVQTQRLKKIPLFADIPSIAILPSTDEITEGTQSIEISLTAQQLTDQINYTGTNPAAIMEEVNGAYLDHRFDVRIEKISKRGALYSWKCCTDIDEILYRQLGYEIPDNERWHRTNNNPDNEIYDYIPMSNASVHISHIAENMGKQPVLFLDDFVSTVDVNANGVTYNDLIGSIFGWTSRVPNMLINVFIRDDKLLVVQRGHEPNTIDLTDTKHTLPNVDSELIRTAWGAQTWSETETRERQGNLVFDHYEFGPAPSGGNSEGDERANGYTYGDDGLVTKSVKTEGHTETTTYYDYITLKGGRKVLSAERTVVYENGTKVDETTTSHTYLGQGQSHSTTYDSDGDYRGGTVGQNTGDDRVSPLTSDKASGWYVYGENGEKKYIKAIHLKYEKIPEERKIYGITLFDTSFPVHGDDKLVEITAAINWLNRRTQETISMSIYAYPHLIDFTDKIVFEGNEYFLVSNTATTTPRIINRQDVTFVRWY